MNTFADFTLADEVRSALTDLQFEKPTKIQAAIIPTALEGQDIVACAQTGSGKTGAYGIPLVSMLLENPKDNALILAPTRELAQQISEFMRTLTKYTQGLGVVALVGGADMGKQIAKLKRRPRIIVATPGRLIDHLTRRTVKLKFMRMLVLDEGDRMLDMGFAPQLDQILTHMPQQVQVSLFTATLPPKIKQLSKTYLNNPKTIVIGETSTPVDTIRQSMIQIQVKEKSERLMLELKKCQGSAIVFSRTKHRTDQLAKVLKQNGFNVDLVHGGRSQGQRNRALDNFRQGKSTILCATDVAARGLDVPQVGHVFNYDLPVMDEDYVHRIGRTARNGSDGEAISFVTPPEHRAWSLMVRKYKIKGCDLSPGSYAQQDRPRNARVQRVRNGSKPHASRGFKPRRHRAQASA